MRTRLEERLNQHPELRERIESMLDILEAKAGVLNNANDAEERVIAELRLLGSELMSDWAKRKEEQHYRRARKADSALKNHNKKN